MLDGDRIFFGRHPTHPHYPIVTKFFQSLGDIWDAPLSCDQNVSITIQWWPNVFTHHLTYKFGHHLTHPHVRRGPICFWSLGKGGMSYVFGNPLPPLYCVRNFLVAIGKGDWEFFDCHNIRDQNILVVARVAIKKIQLPYHVVIKKKFGHYRVRGLFFQSP